MYKDLPTMIVGVRVHITGYADGPCTLRGYAIDNKGVRIDGSGTLKRAAMSVTDIPLAEQHLVAAVVRALPIVTRNSTTGKQNVELDHEHPMVRAFDELIAGNYKVCSTWNDSVENRNISGFKTKLLPKILQYLGKPFTIADREEILSAIADEVRAHGNSRGNEVTVLATARKDMASSAIVYEALRRIDPMLPVLDLVPPRLSKNITDEQLKSLPREVRRKFARKLRQLITKEPVLVLGTVIMWDAGTRTAEAAAVIPALDIEIIGTTSILKIMWQEKNGIRIGVLKTDAAYRKVPLSAWGRKMVKLCCDHIDAWPQDQNIAPMTAEVLRKFITEVLHDCGLEAGYWTAAHESEARNPDRDSQGNPIMDVVAYTLRHDRASIWRNICGLTAAECDYLLGHADYTAKKRKVDYRLEAEQLRIARKLENYVCDDELSEHPGIVPLQLTHGDDLDIMPFERVTWVNTSDTPIVVDLDFIAAEADETVHIHVDNGRIDNIKTRYKPTRGTREDKTLIGIGQLCGKRMEGDD